MAIYSIDKARTMGRGIDRLVTMFATRLGLVIQRVGEPASNRRKIGNMEHFLEDCLVRGFKPRGLVDVGANRGDWANMARKVFGAVPSLLIEPLEEMQPVLRAMARASAEIDVIQAGAGSVASEAVQTVMVEHLAGSSFMPKMDQAKLNDGTQRSTPILRIDDLLAERPDFEPDLVKLDIQGYELEALRGAESTFGRTEIYIVECSLIPEEIEIPSLLEVMFFFKDRSYAPYDIPGFWRQANDGALGQIDLAFVKVGGPLHRLANAGLLT